MRGDTTWRRIFDDPVFVHGGSAPGQPYRGRSRSVGWVEALAPKPNMTPSGRCCWVSLRSTQPTAWVFPCAARRFGGRPQHRFRGPSAAGTRRRERTGTYSQRPPKAVLRSAHGTREKDGVHGARYASAQCTIRSCAGRTLPAENFARQAYRSTSPCRTDAVGTGIAISALASPRPLLGDAYCDENA